MNYYIGEKWKLIPEDETDDKEVYAITDNFKLAAKGSGEGKFLVSDDWKLEPHEDK